MATAGLTADQRQMFHQQGYLCVENLFDATDLEPLIAEFAAIVDRESRALLKQGAIDSLFDEYDFETRLAKISSHSPKAFRALFYTIHTGAAVFELIRHSKLLDIAESLFGPEVALHPNYKVRPKLPDHVPTVVPWHQDSGYMEPECDTVPQVTVWIPLVDATAENGCLEVIPYAHKDGILRHRQADKSFYLHIPDDVLPRVPSVLLPVPVGTVVLLTNLTPHRSAPNRTNRVRWSVDVRYQDAREPTGYQPEGGFLLRSRARPHAVVSDREEFERIQKSHRAGPGPLRWHTQVSQSEFDGRSDRSRIASSDSGAPAAWTNRLTSG